MKESINRPYIIAPIRNTLLGAKLYFEGIYYEKRKIKSLPVGTHLSAFLHNNGKLATIHFRDGLEKLAELQSTPIVMTKTFLNGIEKDHKVLALAMIDPDSPFHEVEDVVGLCGLSSKWGERHGYQTVAWSTTKGVIDRHEVSIINRPSSGNLAIPNPLSLFMQKRDEFIERFLK